MRRHLPLGRDQRGTSGVEFALLAPVMLLILAGMVDFGMTLWARLQLEQSLSTITNYAIVSADNVSASGGVALADRLAVLVPADQDLDLSINNGSTYRRTSGAVTRGGTAADADKCWCPTGTVANLAWGAAKTCGASCDDGSKAGRFVLMSTGKDFTPMFSTYGIVPEGMVTIRSMVQVK